MQIGIIGSGPVGRVLSKAFQSEGYKVMVGTRDKSKDAIIKFREANREILIGTFSETAAFGEILVLATAGRVVLEAISQAGVENFNGKVVIDTTNPIAESAPENGVLKYFTSLDESLMERIQKHIPGARVVKAFNSVGNVYMYKPSFPGGTPSMFICGNDDDAKRKVREILQAFGWETEDMGKVEGARAIEPLCILWCIPGFLRNEWTHSFKLLKQ